MAKIRLTEKLCASLPGPGADDGGRDREYMDVTTTGLSLSVTRSERRFFGLRYRFKKRRRYLRFGEFLPEGGLTLAEARRMVAEARGELARGRDPADTRHLPGDCLTVNDLFREYSEWTRTYKRSHADDTARYDLHLKPAIGRLPLSSVGRKDLEVLLGKTASTRSPATANRVRALVRHMFNTAVRWGHLEDARNPAKDLPQFAEEDRAETFLSPVQAGAFLKALAEDDNEFEALALACLLATGLRCGEVFGLPWSDVDLDRGTVVIRAARSKSKKTRTVHVNKLALRTLERAAELRRDECLWVFPASRGTKTGHVGDCRRIFARAKERAGLPKALRRHDLRHSFATLALGSGANLIEVKRLLGHSSVSVTEKYLHALDDGLRQAAQDAFRDVELPATGSDA